MPITGSTNLQWLEFLTQGNSRTNLRLDVKKAPTWFRRAVNEQRKCWSLLASNYVICHEHWRKRFLCIARQTPAASDTQTHEHTRVHACLKNKKTFCQPARVVWIMTHRLPATAILQHNGLLLSYCIPSSYELFASLIFYRIEYTYFNTQKCILH